MASDVSLDTQMRNLVARLELMPHGTTQQFAAANARRSDSGGRPAGDDKPACDTLREEYNKQHDDHGRERIIAAAQEELDSWRRQSPSEGAIHLDALILEDGEGYAAEHVAERYSVPVSYVQNLRRRADRRADNGNPLDATRPTLMDRRYEVKRLWSEEKLSQRQIAQILGFGVATINEDLRALELRKGER